MIKCPACSREILDDSRLCSYCGAAMQSPPAEPTVTGPPGRPRLQRRRDRRRIPSTRLASHPARCSPSGIVSSACSARAVWARSIGRTT
ncbi:MAG: zinc-ribbon domain-containing protein [Phycisphaerae bacterium]